MTNHGLKTAELFNIEANRPATAKQLYAISQRFAKLQSSTASEAYGLGKVFYAILKKYQTEHSSTPLTQKDMEIFFEVGSVPEKFAKQIRAKSVEPKPAKTSKKSTKTSKPAAAAAPQPKVVAAPKTSKKSASEMSVSEFAAKLNSLNNRVCKLENDSINFAKTISDWAAKTDAHEKSIASLNAKLDILMAYLETDPERMSY